MNLLLEPEGPGRPLAKVLLFFPRFASPPYPVWQPLEIMTLTASLLEARYAVRMIDDRLLDDGREALLEEAHGCLFAGFSARPGDQMARVVQLLPELAARRPEVPVVLGGWFPSGFPKESLALEHVDIVVQGQGDASVVELAERLRRALPLDGLAGVHFRRGEELVLNPRRPLEDMNATPRIPYHRFPLAQYVTFDRCISLTTSRGCAGGCGFCAVPPLYRHEWTGYSAARILDEVEYFVREHGVRIVKFHDVDFLADRERAREFSRGMRERDLDVRWICDGRIHDMATFDDELWRDLRDGGCVEIETGGESGDASRLAAIGKNCDAAQVHRAVERCRDHDITARVNFILGFPRETRRELIETTRLIDRIHALGPRAKIQLYRFTPWPVSALGISTWTISDRGHTGEVPHTASELFSIPINHEEAHMFWLSAAHEERVKRLYYFYLPLLCYVPAGSVAPRRRWILSMLKRLARFRVRHGWTALPFERWIAERGFGYSLPRTEAFEWQQQLS